MRYAHDHALTTYKCEGCGQRFLDGTQVSCDDRDYTVCSPACWDHAHAQYQRQRSDNRLLALVGN